MLTNLCLELIYVYNLLKCCLEWLKKEYEFENLCGIVSFNLKISFKKYHFLTTVKIWTIAVLHFLRHL